MARLKLPDVTLCAATSVNIVPTVAALRASMDQVAFGDVLLFTDLEVANLPDGIRVERIPRLESGDAYSRFLLGSLVDHIRTDYCLVTQWDGFVLDAANWDPAFLQWDYIGAPWPQFVDGYDVGNGGFSLRSRRLLEACRDRRFVISHPEDVAICRLNREFLEVEHGVRFADRAAAQRFAFERTAPGHPTFGFHGVFNLIPAVGPEHFWEIYRTLDDPSTAFVDYWRLMRQLGRGSHALHRRVLFTLNRLRGLAPGHSGGVA